MTSYNTGVYGINTNNVRIHQYLQQCNGWLPAPEPALERLASWQNELPLPPLQLATGLATDRPAPAERPPSSEQPTAFNAL